MKVSWDYHSQYNRKNNIDPENHPFLMETSLPTPICQGRTVNLPEGIWKNHSHVPNHQLEMVGRLASAASSPVPRHDAGLVGDCQRMGNMRWD